MVDLHVALSPTDPIAAEQALQEDLTLEENDAVHLLQALREVEPLHIPPPPDTPVGTPRAPPQRAARRLQPVLRPQPAHPSDPNALDHLIAAAEALQEPPVERIV